MTVQAGFPDWGHASPGVSKVLAHTKAVTIPTQGVTFGPFYVGNWTSVFVQGFMTNIPMVLTIEFFNSTAANQQVALIRRVVGTLKTMTFPAPVVAPYVKFRVANGSGSPKKLSFDALATNSGARDLSMIGLPPVFLATAQALGAGGTTTRALTVTHTGPAQFGGKMGGNNWTMQIQDGTNQIIATRSNANTDRQSLIYLPTRATKLVVHNGTAGPETWWASILPEYCYG